MPPSPNPEAIDAPSSARDSTSLIVEKLTSIGLKKVSWLGRCEADKIAEGRHEVPPNEGGHYALVLDNTFSKSFSKTATFFLLTYPSTQPPQFGAQLHHSQAASSVTQPSQLSKASPALRPAAKESTDSLSQTSTRQAISTFVLPAPLGRSNPSLPSLVTVHAGILQKRRRKRHQGYARRFFSLDFATSTLSYYHDRSSAALRGAIPLSLAAIGTNALTRQISIDSGTDIWHLKAPNQVEFDAWKTALERASRDLANAAPTGDPLKIQPTSRVAGEGSPIEDREWTKVEGLVARVAETRKAVHQLCLETDLKVPIPSDPDSGPTTPTEPPGDDYFKHEDKRPFWKRKASAGNGQSNMFRRSVSAQLAVPASGAEPGLWNGLTRTPSPIRSPMKQALHEESTQDRLQAMLLDLDSVIAEFSALIADSKQRRAPAPQSAVSRLSLDSIESQEYFDAEDKNHSPFLLIRGDSDQDERRGQRPTITDDDSAASSDTDEADAFTGPAKAVRFDSIASPFPPKSKLLSPLPLEAARRRANVAAPTIMPPSLIGFLRKNVGKDLSTITMPVSANEPTSLLQRASEQLEYSTLLDNAAKATDDVERLIYVTAFAISSLSSARVKERSIRKPFNPMLGETFELVREDRGFRFVSEKVSHRPVQLALHAESSEWSFTQSPLPSQKFWGKSSEIVTDGKARLLLHASGETLSWSTATSFLRNVLAGEKYVEPVGTMAVVNETTGQKAVVTFKAKGMFGSRSEEVFAQTFDGHGQELPLGLHGTWTQSLQLSEHGSVTKKTIWMVGPLVEQAPKHYGFTSFAATLNEMTSVEDGKLPPTDSRLRPDQSALEHGNHEKAEELKGQLEERQRERRREMEKGGESWCPRWFTKMEMGEEVVWKLKSGKEGYWEERGRGTWTDVVPVLKL